MSKRVYVASGISGVQITVDKALEIELMGREPYFKGNVALERKVIDIAKEAFSGVYQPTSPTPEIKDKLHKTHTVNYPYSLKHFAEDYQRVVDGDYEYVSADAAIKALDELGFPLYSTNRGIYVKLYFKTDDVDLNAAKTVYKRDHARREITPKHIVELVQADAGPEARKHP